MEFGISRSVSDFGIRDWDALTGDNAFLSHAWLSALEYGRVLSRHRGAEFRIFYGRNPDGKLLFSVLGIRKSHTLGEYGPEVSWLELGRKNGARALPKWQLESPLVPVAGPRINVASKSPKDLTLNRWVWKNLIALTQKQQLGALTVARMLPAEADMAKEQGDFFLSYEIGSVWENRGWCDHSDFMRCLQQRPRNNIQRERRAFLDSKISVRVIPGGEISSHLWDKFYEGYAAVCLRNKARPLLTRDFFSLLGPLSESIWLIAGFQGERFACGTLCVKSGNTLFSRYWSSFERLEWATMELSLHRPIELAFELGLARVDAGVWGGHKASRGYAAVAHPNAHWLADSALAELAKAIARRHYEAFRHGQTVSWVQKYLRTAAT